MLSTFKITVLLYSIVSGIILALAFPLGAIASNVLWTSKAIESLSAFKVSSYNSPNKAEANVGCKVCGDSFCKRQKPFKDNQPWLGLNVPKDVDQAIQDVRIKCNSCIDKHFKYFISHLP